jgi:hypothetical protein
VEGDDNINTPGTKAGIAIGVVVGVGMVAYLAWVGSRKRRNTKLARSTEE